MRPAELTELMKPIEPIQPAVPDVCAARYRLNAIYFYLTEGCNLRCRHCWIDPKFQRHENEYSALDVKLFRSIIDQGKALGLSSVMLTGGEPFLHPQIVDIIDMVRDERLALTITTNGVLCSPGLARRVAACRNPFVSVSLDGAHPQTHEWVRGVEGSFRDAIRGAGNLVAAGIRPQITMSIMRQNFGEMEALVHLAESIGASAVKFNLVYPIARGEKVHEAGQALTIEEMVELGSWVGNTLSKNAKIPLFYDQPVAFRPLGDIFSHKGNCGICHVLGTIGVLPDGTYALCGIGTTVPDLVFGHSAREALSGVWRNTPVLKELRVGFPHRLEGICGECVMNGICRGGCIAQNYYRDKNLWAGFWYCEEARARGLFPELRMKSGFRDRADEAAIGKLATGVADV